MHIEEREEGASTLLSEEEASRIAAELAEKYGHEALDYASSRAARASEIGDALAYDAWQAIIAATRDVLARSPWTVM